jgi:riboflavin-specific deaminase-like protein
MPQPHVVLTSSSSLDCRVDRERPDLLSNRLEEYRIQELRGKVDAIITSYVRVIEQDPEFPVKDTLGKDPAIVIVDKNAETPPDAKILKNHRRKIILVVSKKAIKNRVKRITEKRPDIEVLELGEFAVNLEEMVWELHRAGLRRLHLEGDIGLNMRMLDHNLVNEIYLMLAPVLLGEAHTDIFNGKLDRRMDLTLEGILQYGDHIVLHYNVASKTRS